ncbi:long-chain-fatty-acid--CoA ligase [Halieaceae bacterium IMCC14734]|uniref:Long-chain-fatty-acid--CoA ligase n=1 Tax=Candidatus Litorirhabdus singularis TaxID=2518993 RepID=A0ABT3TFL0_9GAMM|nr:long-chain-fatty-acid--CoA ligase [Candidatus Litorirhabdus singularis]MCX2981098.1 long-chain-fatty-acid--CoA ligase [Candidatus Litorirhabdus singularis]
MLVHQFAEYYARNFPNNPCLTQAGDTTSYGELDQLANRMANGLLKLGIKPGERVAIMGENSLEHLLTFLAAGKIGAVTVSLNYRLAPAELSYIIDDAGARALLILDQTLLECLAAMRADLPAGIEIFTRDSADTHHWDAWLAQQDAGKPAVEVGADDPFLQMYTSGTTGHPKGVVVSHQNVATQIQMNTILMPHRPGPGSADLVCAPLFHIGGAGSVLGGIAAGIEIILHKVFDPAAVVNDIESYNVSAIFMVPAMIMAVLGLPDIEQRDFSKLRQIYYGASPISESVLKRAIEVFGARFIQMYGMTETCGTVVNLSPADHDRALAGEPELLRSCGRPSIGVQLKIMDTNGRPVATGEVGEIWAHASCNMIGYHNLAEETAKNLTDGWVHTGDAGYLDAEGFLYLKDRIKDMVVSGGENIYPVEVENALASHAAIADVAVIGVPNEKFGEALLAFAVLKPDCSLTADEMIDFCRDKIAGYKIPRQLEILQEMPRNPSGKILKKELRKPYWEGVNRNIG